MEQIILEEDGFSFTFSKCSKANEKKIFISFFLNIRLFKCKTFSINKIVSFSRRENYMKTCGSPGVFHNLSEIKFYISAMASPDRARTFTEIALVYRLFFIISSLLLINV